MSEDMLCERLTNILDNARWDWDRAKIADAIRHGEATVEEVVAHILAFEVRNPRGWNEPTARAKRNT
jgi:hypothetical protein